MTNKETSTRWAIKPKIGGMFLPLLNFTYLVSLAQDKAGDGNASGNDSDPYEATIITVPDRSYIWIMGRSPSVSDQCICLCCIFVASTPRPPPLFLFLKLEVPRDFTVL